MSEIHVSVTDQVMKLTQSPTLASGGVNETKVVFTFCEKWDGFVKTALFYRDTEKVYYAILENDTCILPWEVYAENGTFFFTVFGDKDTTRRTAGVLRYKVGKGIVADDAMPSDPTPDVYDQIMALLAKNNDIAADLEEKRDSGYFNGEKGEKGDKGDKGDQGDPGTPGSALIDDSVASTENAWSSKNTVDKLCPTFTESGSVVTCEPVEGYPLEVTAEEGATITRCGKNIWRFENMGKQYSINGDSNAAKLETGVRANQTRANAGYCSIMCRWLPISVLDGKTITISCNIAPSVSSLVPMLQIGYFSETMTKRKGVTEIYKSGSLSLNVDSKNTAADGCEYIGFWFYIQTGDGRQVKAGDYVDFTDFQIEISNTATAYEPYKGVTYSVGEPIPALPGTNTIYADVGTVTVTGKANPSAIIEKLTNAILSLGGNV